MTSYPPSSRCHLTRHLHGAILPAIFTPSSRCHLTVFIPILIYQIDWSGMHWHRFSIWSPVNTADIKCCITQGKALHVNQTILRNIEIFQCNICMQKRRIILIWWLSGVVGRIQYLCFVYDKKRIIIMYIIMRVCMCNTAHAMQWSFNCSYCYMSGNNSWSCFKYFKSAR